MAKRRDLFPGVTVVAWFLKGRVWLSQWVVRAMWDELKSRLAGYLLNAWVEYPAKILIKVQENVSAPFGLDMTIEGLNKRGYSVFIFAFLIMQIILFSFMIYVYMKKTKAALKTGEKVMFGALMMGIVIGVIIGWTQLIEGYLF